MIAVRRRKQSGVVVRDVLDEILANLTAGHRLPSVRPMRSDAVRARAIRDTERKRQRRLREVAAGGWRA